MKKITGYILFKLSIYVFICHFLFSFIFVFFDYLENKSDMDFSLLQTIEYYTHYLILANSTFFSFIIIVSFMILLLVFNRKNYFVVFLSSGIPREFIARKILLFIYFYCFSFFMVNEFMVPKSNHIFQKMYFTYVKKDPRALESPNSVWTLSKDYLIYIDSIKSSDSLKNISLYKNNSQSMKIEQIIHAESLTLNEKKWILNKVQVLDFVPEYRLKTEAQLTILNQSLLVPEKKINTKYSLGSIFDSLKKIKTLENVNLSTYKYWLSAFSLFSFYLFPAICFISFYGGLFGFKRENIRFIDFSPFILSILFFWGYQNLVKNLNISSIFLSALICFFPLAFILGVGIVKDSLNFKMR